MGLSCRLKVEGHAHLSAEWVFKKLHWFFESQCFGDMVDIVIILKC